MFKNNLTKFLAVGTAILLIISALIYIQRPTLKVFQIGPSRCGTTTLSDFFNANGILSAHDDQCRLALSMQDNYINNKPLMSGKYAKYTGYFDMNCVMPVFPPIYGPKFFKELDAQYPGSKFILNTRDRAALFRSLGSVYLNFYAEQMKLSTDEVLAIWSKDLDAHFAEVLEYFKDRPNDLLVFNIETDKPKKLADFFKDDFTLNPKFYIHKNKTIRRGYDFDNF